MTKNLNIDKNDVLNNGSLDEQVDMLQKVINHDIDYLLKEKYKIPIYVDSLNHDQIKYLRKIFHTLTLEINAGDNANKFNVEYTTRRIIDYYNHIISKLDIIYKDTDEDNSNRAFSIMNDISINIKLIEIYRNMKELEVHQP